MYRHHAFISYAWADDQSFAAAGGPDQQGANRGWVSTFHDHYRNHLGREIGRIPEGERIWLDYEQLHGNDAITPEILDALKHSALLIPIISNAWFASPWCRQEFTTFTEHYPDWRERLFPVWMAPVEPDDLDEEARAIRERLRKLLGYQFWYRDQAKEIYTHWFPDPDPTDRDYHNIQQKMARHMTERLRQLKQLGQLTEDVSNPTPTRPLRGRSPTPCGPPVPPIEGSYFVMITGGSSDLSLVQDISRVLGTREGLCYLVPLIAYPTTLLIYLMKLVLDSSVIVKFFLQEILSDKARALLVDIGEGVHEAHIPSLACYEVLGVLSRHLSTQAEIGKHLSSLFDLIDSGAIRSHSVEQNLW